MSLPMWTISTAIWAAPIAKIESVSRADKRRRLLAAETIGSATTEGALTWQVNHLPKRRKRSSFR